MRSPAGSSTLLSCQRCALCALISESQGVFGLTRGVAGVKVTLDNLGRGSSSPGSIRICIQGIQASASILNTPSCQTQILCTNVDYTRSDHNSSSFHDPRMPLRKFHINARRLDAKRRNSETRVDIRQYNPIQLQYSVVMVVYYKPSC
ncbi:hypothetical protein BDN72DRAFT_589695 [Pluteus cervinus]|uniref:Uncharacterized protein n=1 Tax=Pluteus cervinus TaxID=181527 RepID=A0ACD3AWS2_9AGAR|nr:hypothetical protein BDN72DRAFT_589695 [Pluteus cervinus]